MPTKFIPDIPRRRVHGQNGKKPTALEGKDLSTWIISGCFTAGMTIKDVTLMIQPEFISGKTAPFLSQAVSLTDPSQILQPGPVPHHLPVLPVMISVEPTCFLPTCSITTFTTTV
ncbi:hypothetical protein AMECASPLE_024373 [Ameca splendens]|uniref:Uncharacterized protein n=1 Tax=Ameca splendens TaxID=208324 RepID=A0ABV0ZZX4_9TELE